MGRTRRLRLATDNPLSRSPAQGATELATDWLERHLASVSRRGSNRAQITPYRLVWLKPQPNGDVTKDREVFHNVER